MITVEPGIYLPLNNTLIHEKWRGLAVRIEDDLLITPTGFDVLTKRAPKEVKDIEDLMVDRTQFSAYVWNKACL